MGGGEAEERRRMKKAKLHPDTGTLAQIVCAACDAQTARRPGKRPRFCFVLPAGN